MTDSPSGRVLQINVSAGGVPKLPIDTARVGRFGIDGDAHTDLTVHGGPHMALCLFGVEAIERLQAEGHPIAPGGAGENLTTVGIEWSLLPLGTRALIGDEVELEISGDAGPCKTIRGNFSDGRFSRMSIDSHPSDSRMYARVLRGGEIRSGDLIALLPPAPDSRAVEEFMLSRLDRAEMKSSLAAWRAAAEAGYTVAVMEDGDLAAASSAEIPGPAFNHAFGLPALPNLLRMLTDFYDAHGTPGWLSADAPPWPGATSALDLDTFANEPSAVGDVPLPAGVVVRQIGLGEAAAYNAVLSGNVTAGGIAAGGPNPWPQVYERLVASNSRLLFVAELDGQPVANASLHVSARTGWLRGALVAPEARGRGIQCALIAARARAAEEGGCDLIGSSAEPGGVSARNLQRAGLRRIGQRGNYEYQPGVNPLVSDLLRLERTGPRGVIARVTLTRPEVHNAFNAELIGELRSLFRRLADEPVEQLRGVVLAGDGPSFCAGADVTWMRASMGLTREQNEQDAMVMAEMFDAIDRCPVPVVARVQGAALGGGMGLCAVSDLVIAESGAKFGFTETRLGILPAVIAPFVIAKIGETHARALFPGGRRFDAGRALRIGLVHEVVEGEPALDAAVETALADVLAAGPTAARAAKAVIREVRGLPHESTRWHTARRIAAQRAGAEGQEGLRAFLEKREPGWRRGDAQG